MVNINKNPAWFRTVSRCKYSDLSVSHPEVFVSRHPGSNYFVDMAKLGDQIVLVKASGYVRFYETNELLSFFDDYLSTHFDKTNGIIYLEDYVDVEGADSAARKEYIEYYLKMKNVFIAGILYNQSILFKISFKIARRFHALLNQVYDLNTYEQAIALALKIIGQHDAAQCRDDKFEGVGPPLTPKASASVLGVVSEKFKHFKEKRFSRFTENITRKYSEALLKYIAAIDWNKDGFDPPKNNLQADQSVRKVFDAIRYIKSEVDDLLRQRDATETVLRESEARSRQLVEHARASIIEYDYSVNRIISVNDSFLDITGYSKDEILSMNPFNLMPDESQKLFAERISQLRAGKSVAPDVVYQLISKQNKIKWILFNPSITFKHQQPDTAKIVIIDISHLKEVESKLLDYQSKLKKLSIRMSKSEETQRRQLASQLHESVSQELFAAQLKLNALEKSLNDPKYDHQLDEIKTQIVKSIREIRGITYDLSPPVLYDLGLKEAVKSLAKSIEAKYCLTVKARFNGRLSHLDDDMKIIIYRIIKEILHNSIKHAQADCINIIIDNTNKHLRVDVSDNGVGFDAGSLSEGHYTGDGFGLFDIKEKINHLSGRLTIHSPPGSGTRIGLSVPLNDPEGPC